ncbi:MAG: prepilin peptidase [Rickettsiales bacterium]|nr:prepilin peptidase [Rickettsiales bacterium]
MPLLFILLIFCMLAVLWFDTTRYIIPNWISAALLVAYAFAAYAAPITPDWQMAIAGMGIVLVVGYALFAFKLMGAGDIKLMTVLALWTGLSNLPDFLFLTGIIGGVLSLVLWIGRKWLPYLPKKPKKENLPRILQEGAPVPCGVAIALAFLSLLWSSKIPVLAAA